MTVTELPTTASGKVIKRELLRTWWGHGRAVCCLRPSAAGVPPRRPSAGPMSCTGNVRL